MQGRDIPILIGGLVLAILLLGLLGGGMISWGMMGSGMMGNGWGFGPWWGSLFMLFFWALVLGGGVLLILWLARLGRPSAAGPDAGSDRALAILRERYARGELTPEQYEQMRGHLE